MVNTFITDKDFKQSAKNLDYRRLGKQRVECGQIISLLNKELPEVVKYMRTDLSEKRAEILPVFDFARKTLQAIRATTDINQIKKLWNSSPYYKTGLKAGQWKVAPTAQFTEIDLTEFSQMISLPAQLTESSEQEFCTFQNIVDNIVYIYKIYPFWVGYRGNEYYDVPRTKNFIMISSGKYDLVDDEVKYKNKTYSRDQVFITSENERILKLSWINHTCTRMWLGYLECLKFYYNIHIDEWINQGYQNTMVKYPIGEVVIPHWLNEQFINNHKGALHFKDPVYYEKYQAYPFTDYLWPAANISRRIGEMKESED